MKGVRHVFFSTLLVQLSWSSQISCRELADYGSAMEMWIDELVLFSMDAPLSAAFIDANLVSLLKRPDEPGPARLRFEPGQRLDETDQELSSAFWKFSVFTDSVDRLAESIRRGGAATSQAGQFLDIGYLCHLNEPGGNEIELLQRQFSPPLARPAPTGFSGEETLGLITLRVTDITSTMTLLEQGFGMKRLATMHVDGGRSDPFSLEFLALTNEQPPNKDLSHVDNREWLYQRPYTIVELQHGPSISVVAPTPGPQGFGLSHISIVGPGIDETRRRIGALGTRTVEGGDGAVIVATPDGHRFVLNQDPSR